MAYLSADRKLIRSLGPRRAKIGDGFEALQIDREMLGNEGDPFLSLDHFKMRSPTFAPHAHAGFSAVTYVLPESKTGMQNRDSLGDFSRIEPGALHWTAAGKGIVHEEIPQILGQVAEGMQIFVRQPLNGETAAPRIHHIDSTDVPVVRLSRQGHIRVLAGLFESQQAAFATPSNLTLLDVILPKASMFYWPDSTPHVRRQNIWHNSRCKLAERVGLVGGLMFRRLSCGAASADVRWSFV